MNITMLDEELAPVNSRNVFGEIRGREFPEEIVGLSGHIDAWDVGQGAMDDAGGVFISTESLTLIKSLGLVPRRTLQAILWTAEEFGVIGVQAFVDQHQTDMIKYNAVFESDTGTFKPRGLDFAGSPEAGCIVQEVLQLLASINATEYQRFPSVSSDISYMIDEGVPGLSLSTENDQYFYFHHSAADMLSVLDSTELDLDTALWATVGYVLADLSVPLPRLEAIKKIDNLRY
jgi:carboxypeptidase Q